MKYKIEYEYDTERINEEASMKGWRSDVIASIDSNKFMLNIIDPIRLSQDFESEMLKYGFYNMEPNTIIVKEVFKSEIEKTIKKLVNLCYFDKLGPAKYSINNGNKIVFKESKSIQDIEIIFNRDIKYNDYESMISGYRDDVNVIINDKAYNVYAITIVRMFQEYIRDEIFHSSVLNNPNLILVKDITNNEILRTIEKLHSNGFFDKLGQLK